MSKGKQATNNLVLRTSEFVIGLARNQYVNIGDNGILVSMDKKINVDKQDPRKADAFRRQFQCCMLQNMVSGR